MVCLSRSTVGGSPDRACAQPERNRDSLAPQESNLKTTFFIESFLGFFHPYSFAVLNFDIPRAQEWQSLVPPPAYKTVKDHYALYELQ